MPTFIKVLIYVKFLTLRVDILVPLISALALLSRITPDCIHRDMFGARDQTHVV